MRNVVVAACAVAIVLVITALTLSLHALRDECDGSYQVKFERCL